MPPKQDPLEERLSGVTTASAALYRFGHYLREQIIEYAKAHKDKLKLEILPEKLNHTHEGKPAYYIRKRGFLHFPSTIVKFEGDTTFPSHLFTLSLHVKDKDISPLVEKLFRNYYNIMQQTAHVRGFNGLAFTFHYDFNKKRDPLCLNYEVTNQ